VCSTIAGLNSKNTAIVDIFANSSFFSLAHIECLHSIFVEVIYVIKNMTST